MNAKPKSADATFDPSASPGSRFTPEPEPSPITEAMFENAKKRAMRRLFDKPLDLIAFTADFFKVKS